MQRTIHDKSQVVKSLQSPSVSRDRGLNHMARHADCVRARLWIIGTKQPDGDPIATLVTNLFGFQRWMFHSVRTVEVREWKHIFSVGVVNN